MRVPPYERAIVEICCGMGRSLLLGYPRDSEPVHVGSTFFTSEVLTPAARRPPHCPHNRPGQHGIRDTCYTSVALVCEIDGYDTLRQARAAIKTKMQNGLFAIALSVEGETLSTT
jgi:hypothetical protein